MEEAAEKILLQGITLIQFKILYLVGVSGIIVRFLYNIASGVWIKKDGFQLIRFLRGCARVLGSLMFMAVIIARFQEFSHLLVTVEISSPAELPEGVEVVAGITAGSAFSTGMVIDDIFKRAMSKGVKMINQRKK